MRFLLTSHVAPPHIGGVENLVAAEARALLAAGHDVTWLTSDAGGAGAGLEPHPRLRLLRLRAWHGLERRFGIAFPVFGPGLIRHLVREVRAADVVHAHGLVFLASPLAMVLARLSGRTAICTDHGGLLRYRWSVVTLALRVLFATLGRVTAHAAHRLIAYNGDIEKLLVRLGGDAAKVGFLQNPVDAAWWRPPTPAEREAARASLGWDERPRVLFVARLLPHKGIDVVLDAKEPWWEAVFCGPGDETMRAHIRARGGECHLPRPQPELRVLYHAADAFVLPSHNEGFPVVVQEALACGLPVVTSDVPAYAPYRTTPGLHLCAATPAAVRAAVARVLREPRSARAGRVPASGGEHAWLQQLLAPLAATARRGRAWSWAVVVVLVLLAVHVGLGLVRLPGKVVGKRIDEVAAYRERGAARFLIEGSKLDGASDLAWLLREAPAGSAVLWRWPSDGALEFAAALLAPRLLLDERTVPPGAVQFRGVPLAAGRLPDGRRGVFVLQGTPAQGLVLRVRED